MNIIQELKKILYVFSYKDQQKLLLVTFIQVFLAALDLLGVAIIGIIGAVTVYGIQSKGTGDRVLTILEFFNLESMSFQYQVAYLGAFAVFIFISKTVSSVFLTRKTLFFISKRGALVSSNLIKSLFSKSIIEINKYTHQELIFASTTGIDVMTTRVVGSTIMVISDTALLIVLFVGLMIVNPTISLSILLAFLSLGLITNKFLKLKAFKLGIKEAGFGVKSNETISEVLNTYREAVVRNRRSFYISSIKDLRYSLAEVTAKRNFMPNLNKYIMEIALIVGALLVAGVQFLINDATHAITNLTIFLAAATRIAPAVLRIQLGLLSIKSGLGTVGRTLEIITDVNSGEHQEVLNKMPDFNYTGFNSSVKAINLEFSYNINRKFVLHEINLDVSPGAHLAITGNSGAGKTTLVDILLGVLKPTNGNVYISGVDPLLAFQTWPGATAYVPQDIVVVNGTVWDNVALGFSHDLLHETYIWDALKLAHLDSYIKSLPEGLLTQVGERGHKLSGGQRQRLGIARALFTKPKLLVLDEATSALDGETEADIAEAIKSLKGSTTVLLIAHRLSSVRNADQVMFMNNGKIEAIGSFETVRKIAPNFDKQANLMGL